MVDPSDNARSRGRGSVGAGGDPLASLFNTMGGEDCDRPQCDDTKSALTMALRRVHNNDVEQIQPSTKLCPPSKDEIGSSTWTLLHSMVRERHTHRRFFGYSHSLRLGSLVPRKPHQ